MGFPTQKEIVAFLRQAHGEVLLKEFWAAFHLKPSQRKAFGELLESLRQRGLLTSGPYRLRRRTQHPHKLKAPHVSAAHTPAPLTEGLATTEDRKALPVVGVYSPPSLEDLQQGCRGYVRSMLKKDRHLGDVWLQEGSDPPSEGAVVVADLIRKRAYGPWIGRLRCTLGAVGDPALIPLVDLIAEDIPRHFSKTAEEEAALRLSHRGDRLENWRDIDFVTIDGADARDFDDAVAARPHPRLKNHWLLYVAVADVSFYVPSGGALDREAYDRGVSVYLPPYVVPMLPFSLSEEACSLKEGVDRRILGVCLELDDKGQLLAYTFKRAWIRSRGRLTYEQVHHARAGRPDSQTAPLKAPVLDPLYAVYALLEAQRQARHSLDLDLPERKIVLNAEGYPQAIGVVERLSSHRLIEEMMILANVAAALYLEENKRPCLYRIHPPVAAVQWAAFRAVMEPLGLNVHIKKPPQVEDINRLLAEGRRKGLGETLALLLLRAQSQALYSPRNQGHFGLSLPAYAHFTSPIRRYSDLVTHRLICRSLEGRKESLYEGEALERIGTHLSGRSRRAEAVERRVADRYLSRYVAVDGVGKEFEASVSGVVKGGLFVRLAETLAEGFLPVRFLPEDSYFFDKRTLKLLGRRHHLEFTMAQPLVVRLEQLEVPQESLLFSWVSGGRPAKKIQTAHRGAKQAKKRFRPQGGH